MSNYFTVLTFTHANLKRPVEVVAGTISFYLYSDKAKANCIFTTGGNIIPVEESLETLKEKIQNLNTNQIGGNSGTR